MSSAPRPWTQRILQLIDEGVTDREALITGATPFVPQGHAHRVRERQNKRMAARRREEGRPQGSGRITSTSEAYRVGARQVVHKALQNLCKCGRLVRDGDQFRRLR